MSHSQFFNLPIPTMAKAIRWPGLHGATLGLALSEIINTYRQPILIIAESADTVANLLAEIKFFSDPNILYFADRETLPYDHFSPHQDIISDRLSTLFHLSQAPRTTITTLNTILQVLPPKTYLNAYSFILKIGDKLDPTLFSEKLVTSGYHHVSQVREHGEYAVRGSIIDLFPMGSDQPLRIDLFDDEIDSIRLFSVDTQRTSEKVDQINLLPAKEFPLTEDAIDHFRNAWRHIFAGNPLKNPIYQDVSEGICAAGIEYYLPLFFDETATLFDYLPNDTLIIAVGNLDAKAQEIWQEINLRYEQMRHDKARPILPPDQLFLSQQQYQTAISQRGRINIEYDQQLPTAIANLAIDYKAQIPLSALQKFLATYQGRVLFSAESLGRREVLLQLFKQIDLFPPFYSDWSTFLAGDSQYGMVVAPIESGFCLENPAITLIAEAQLYGARIMQRRLRKKTEHDPDKLFRDLTELEINSPVVHLTHGIGRYLGLQTLSVGEQVNEFLTIEYAAGDKLFVPVSSLHLISRYTGANPDHIPINKLGSENWGRAKRKAAEKVHDVAADLLDLYAKREAQIGHAYEFPTEAYQRFAAQFPFEETPDQLQAIEAVFQDMQSQKPMDRVICGDVGFGKTEVALRAAFLAAHNSKQVAILVPTTLLAEQHYHTFQDRFADWPITVDLLSRFRSAKEQKKTLEGLASGRIDIVIGTHKLLQKELAFKNLGLIVIDEEHRFGVKQKERLKALRTMSDILTMTATPIPRTLNMALAGIRDLSIIATPPAKRLSVKTFVHEYKDFLIQEAIQREIMRGGQVYFLHNEVQTIFKKSEEIKALIPDARVSVAHGQMQERELEKVMSDFYHRHANILICTTIIESGIDIPTANTIIINRADKLGLAQLHQLRGRVGRSHHQAYAYLFIQSDKLITADAAKRLEAISNYDTLGIGFTLATQDLEIRGAGELLGEEQSGDMHAIGFNLYMDLLTRAVDALKSKKTIDLEKYLQPNVVEIDLHISAIIPEKYLGDVQLRLQFYKKIAASKTETGLDEIQVEMIDRFGLLPDALKNLFAITSIKLRAEALGIQKIDAGNAGGKIEFNSRPTVKPETIIRLIQEKNTPFKLEGAERMRFSLPPHATIERLSLIDDILNQLSH